MPSDHLPGAVPADLTPAVRARTLVAECTAVRLDKISDRDPALWPGIDTVMLDHFGGVFLSVDPDAVAEQEHLQLTCRSSAFDLGEVQLIGRCGARVASASLRGARSLSPRGTSVQGHSAPGTETRWPTSSPSTSRT